MTSILLALTLLATPAVPGNPYLEQGRKRYQNLEYEATLDLLKQAMSWPGTTAPELAQIHLFRGLCHLQLGGDASGKAAFRAALLADPEVQLPPMTSPKIRQIFQAESDALAKHPIAPQLPVAPDPPRPADTPLAPQPEKPLATAPVAPEPEGQPPVTEPPPPTSDRSGAREHVRWPAYLTLGTAVVAAGVGGGFGYLAKDLSDQSSAAHYASDNVRLNQQARNRARVANGLYGTAAGLAVLGGVFFFVF